MTGENYLKHSHSSFIAKPFPVLPIRIVFDTDAATIRVASRVIQPRPDTMENCYQRTDDLECTHPLAAGLRTKTEVSNNTYS